MTGEGEHPKAYETLQEPSAEEAGHPWEARSSWGERSLCGSVLVPGAALPERTGLPADGQKLSSTLCNKMGTRVFAAERVPGCRTRS